MAYIYIVPDYIKKYVESLGYNLEEYHIKWRPKEIGGYIDLIKKEADKPVEITCKLELTPTPNPNKRLNVTNTQESKMVKVGDRVKLVKEYGAWCSDNVGKEGTVMEREPGGYVTVAFDDSEGEAFEEDWGRSDHLELISTTPTYAIPADTETVTLKYADGSTQDIDVKDRARGVPEWVKDGAWVVNVVNDELRKVIKREDGKFDLAVNDLVSIRYHDGLRHQYRPFTNSDWKWGMWAEYRGEKVFVCSSAMLGTIGISRSPENTGESAKIAYVVGVSTSELTPTTAP